MYFFWKRIHRRLLFLGPSLRQESKLGYDIRVFAPRFRPFYIQFKAGKKDSTNVVTFEINNNTHNNQYHLLGKLSKQAIVLYGMPLMFSMTEVAKNRWQLLKHTRWINVAAMPKLPPPPNCKHKVRVNLATGNYNLHSTRNRGFGEAWYWDETYSLLAERAEFLDSELDYQENILAIRETFQSDELPDDTAYGLVFGAIPP